MQTVQNTQNFFRVTADVQVVHRNVLDRVVRIDDERGAQCDASFLVAHAELVDQFALDVAERVVVQLVQVLVLTAPCELDEFVVDAAAEQDGVTLFEVLGQLAELDDFRRANEREVLRVEIDDLPLARERRFGDFFERRYAVLFVVVETGFAAVTVKASTLSPTVFMR